MGYDHDSVGLVTAVTGSGFASVSSYASNRKFRAWGALKSMDYGNSLSLSAGHNSRLKVTSYAVAGIMGSAITYNDDGTTSYAHDTVDNKFDRAYTFDQAGQLTLATTGDEARGGTTTDGPYRESFTYDAWSNMTNHATRQWSENFGGVSATYTNDRHADWTYDASGNPTQEEDETVFVYDAAGRNSSSYNPAFQESCGTSSPYEVGRTDVNTYDGDGQKTKLAETNSIGGGPGLTITKYYLRSSVLGGELLNLLSSSGTKETGFVYAGGGLLAKQWKPGGTEKVIWEHTNPATGSIWHTDDTGALTGREELDPLGADMGIVDPYTSGTGGGGSDGTGDCGLAHYHTQRPASNDTDGSCFLNGMEAPCGVVMDMVNHGAGSELDLNTQDVWGRPLQNPIRDPFDVHYDAPMPDNSSPADPTQAEYAARLTPATGSDMIGKSEDGGNESGLLIANFDINIGVAGVVNIKGDPDPILYDDNPYASSPFPEQGQKKGATPPDFRGFSAGALKTVRSDVKQAGGFLRKDYCRNGLQKAGINVAKLIAAFNVISNQINSSQNVSGSNIYNAETSTDPRVVNALANDDNVKKSNAFVFVGDTNIYLRKSFFSARGGGIDANVSRALVLIHEAIHVAGYTDSAFGTSANIDNIVVKACFNASLGHDDLGIVGN